MSQEKVDFYKKQKVHRKSFTKRKKLKDFIWALCAILVLAAAIGWVSYSGYQKHEASKDRTEVEVDLTALTDYASSISTEEVDTDDSSEESSDSSAESSDSSADASTDETSSTESSSDSSAQ